MSVLHETCPFDFYMSNFALLLAVAYMIAHIHTVCCTRMQDTWKDVQDHYEDMIKIMTGGLDEDGFVTKGHISNAQDLLNREKNHVANCLSSNQVHYLQVAHATSFVSRMRHKRKLDQKHVSSADQGAESAASSCRPVYKDLGMGSTLLARQSAAAVTIQKFHRDKQTTAITSDPVSPKSPPVPTVEKQHGAKDKHKAAIRRKGKSGQRKVALADMSDRPPSFDLEDQRVAGGKALATFENPLNE